MSESTTRAWFESYFRAFAAKDVEAFEVLFSEDGTYEVVDPFEEWTDYGWMMRGRSQIQEGLRGLFASSEKWDLLEYEVLRATADLGIANVRLHWVNSSTEKEMRCDFIIVVKLNAGGRCTSIRDWSRVRAREDAG